MTLASLPGPRPVRRPNRPPIAAPEAAPPCAARHLRARAPLRAQPRVARLRPPRASRLPVPRCACHAPSVPRPLRHTRGRGESGPAPGPSAALRHARLHISSPVGYRDHRAQGTLNPKLSIYLQLLQAFRSCGSTFPWCLPVSLNPLYASNVTSGTLLVSRGGMGTTKLNNNQIYLEME